ncbi:hypothetical protein LOM8899_04360 [Flavimaricola marinus]|uniref:Uncharacterized protein n=1 Tax=Flavimaricola marinus TaxID=1819565 RepID=A0A238LLA7_9RHOB|nr:hypothetical protein LOM8899_04360 [Flavimaricola marinus]
MMSERFQMTASGIAKADYVRRTCSYRKAAMWIILTME